MYKKSSLLLLLIITAGFTQSLKAQFIVSGTVFDSSRRNVVEGVRVECTDGKYTTTDSMGNYKLQVETTDSLTFTFQNKPTQKFAVKDIADPAQFDISLRVHVKSKYNTLKEVVVIAKSYRQDSIENRQLYSQYYDFHKPTIQSSISPDGAVGADLDEIINMFRFRRNKQLKAFRARLEQQEQEKFVDYRFNRTFVKRITHIEGVQLDTFMVRYRPTYEFASMADEVTFNKYILNASYEFKIELLKQDAKK